MEWPPEEVKREKSDERCVGTLMVMVVKETPDVMEVLDGRSAVEIGAKEATWGFHVSVAVGGAGEGLGGYQYLKLYKRGGRR